MQKCQQLHRLKKTTPIFIKLISKCFLRKCLAYDMCWFGCGQTGFGIWKRIFHRKFLTHINLYRPSKTELNNFWFFRRQVNCCIRDKSADDQPSKRVLLIFFFFDGNLKFLPNTGGIILIGFVRPILFATTWTKNKLLFSQVFKARRHDWISGRFGTHGSREKSLIFLK